MKRPREVERQTKQQASMSRGALPAIARITWHRQIKRMESDSNFHLHLDVCSAKQVYHAPLSWPSLLRKRHVARSELPPSEEKRSVLIPGTSTASVVRAHWWHTLLAAAFAPAVLFCSQLKTGFCLRPPPARHNSAHHGSCRTSSRGIRCSDDRPHHHPQVGRRRRRPHRSGGVQTDDMRQVHRVHH